MIRLKKYLCVLLILSLYVGGLSLNVSSADTITEMRRKQSEIRAKEKAANERLEEIQKEKKTLLTEIEMLDIEIQLAEDQLQFIKDRLEATIEEHEKTVEELKLAEDERANYYIALKKRLKYIQENGRIGYYQVLFNSKGFGDFLNRVEYVNDIIAYDQNMYNRLTEIEDSIDEHRKQIERQLAEIEVLLQQQEEKKLELDQAMAAKEALLKEAESDEAKYNEQIEILEKESGELERKIKAAQEEAARAAAAAAAAAAARRNSGGSSSSTRLPGSSGSGVSPSGQLGWPVPGNYRLSSGYVNRTNPITGKREFHTGIDIPASKGTSIVAAESGRVIMAGSNGGYGICVVIDHGNGMSTLYGHNSGLAVSVGDTVSRGQTIAYCGSTGMSTGNHCHFEVRINGSPTNPGPYVGI